MISTLGPLEDLLAADSINSDSHQNTVIRELSHREGVLAAAGGPLVGDELVALLGHGGLALPAVCRFLIKLLSEPELEVDALHGGLGDHVPLARGLGDGHGGGGGQSGLPQHEANIEGLEDLLVVL